MKKIILSIAMGLVGMTTYAQTQCYKDSLAWTLQGGMSNYIPFCGNNYDNSTIPSNVKLWTPPSFTNQIYDSVYQLCGNSYDRPTLTGDRFNGINKSMIFDGNDFLTYKVNGFPTGNTPYVWCGQSFSFSVWVKPNSSSVGSIKTVLGVNSICTNTHYTGLGLSNSVMAYKTTPMLLLENDKVYMCLTTQDGNPHPSITITQPKKVEVGTINTNWTNYSGVYNSTTQKAYYYVNGSLVDSVTQPNNLHFIFNAFNGLNVGGSVGITYECGYYSGAGFSQGFEGKIDDILFYNRTLTHNEVASIYQTSGNYDLEKVDTMYIHDTITIVNCQYYDTTYVSVYDTIQVPFYYDVPVMIYDTTYVNINVYDTIRVNVYDTLFIDFNKWYLNTNTNNIVNVSTEYIKVYPNPVMGSMALKIDVGNLFNLNPANQCIQYVLYDGLGQVVYVGQITSQLTSLNIDNFSSGTYTLFLADNSGQTTTKKITIIN